MDPSILLYIAVVVAAAAFYMVLKPGKPLVRGGAAILALGAVAWLFVMLIDTVGGGSADTRPPAVFLIFAFVAIGAAGRMITHSRPVYSALYFILVVLSSAALFLLMDAEFMAFALVIIYAGAILVTYMFVLMLAQQAPDPEHEDEIPVYDRIPREPAAAVIVGFIMLALLSRMVIDLDETMPTQPTYRSYLKEGWHELARLPRQLENYVEDIEEGDFTLGWGADSAVETLGYAPDGETAVLRYQTAEGEQKTLELVADEHLPNNVQRVGIALVADFPASLELAGIILLMAMFGAVVLARRQIELGEDELREAAGMSQYTLDAADTESASEGGGA